MYRVTIVQEVVVGGMVREEDIIHFHFEEFGDAVELAHAVRANHDNEITHTYCIISKENNS